MITEYVLFDVDPAMSREDVERSMREIAPLWRDNPALIRKTFIYDPVAGQGGAFYLWQNREAARQAHNEAWRRRILATYGGEPQIRYFETPVVVDNAVGEIIVSGG